MNINHFPEVRKQPDVVNFKLYFMIGSKKISQDSRYLLVSIFARVSKKPTIDLGLKFS